MEESQAPGKRYAPISGFTCLRTERVPPATSQELIDQILPLHVQGLRDIDISQRLRSGKYPVQKHLIGRRVHHKRKKRTYIDAEHATCTICDTIKHIDDFPAPRSNGKSETLSEISF